MTATIRETAERLCDGRLVMVHEGSYADTYVPFCGHAVIEELAGCALKWLIRFCLCWKGSDQIQYFVLFSVRQSAGWQYIYCVKKSVARRNREGDLSLQLFAGGLVNGCAWRGAAECGGVPAIAFAQNSRGELRLESGHGQISGARSTGGGKPGQRLPMVLSVALRGSARGLASERAGAIADDTARQQRRQ